MPLAQNITNLYNDYNSRDVTTAHPQIRYRYILDVKQ